MSNVAIDTLKTASINNVVGTLELEIFRFNPNADYEFYFQKYTIAFTKGKPTHTQISTNQTLREILACIDSDLSFSQSIELKINGIALLEDENLSALIDRFGIEWRIEPLNTLYVKKDLLLDKEAMLKQYEDFFSKCDFILPDERERLYQYLPINLVSQRSREYLGDGFFLFVKWLAQRHTKHLDILLESINDTKNGVLAYASIQNLLYKPNPQIDKDIEWLIESLLASHKQIRQNLIKYPKQDFIDYQKDFIDSSAFATSKYIIFNGYDTRYAKESSELVASCKELCEKTLCKTLGITVSSEKIDFIYNGGHFTRIADLSAFVKRTLHNILQANAKGYTVLFGDYASFCEARFALEINLVLEASAHTKSPQSPLDTNKLKDFVESTQNLINKHPKKDHINAWLKQKPIAYIGDLLAKHFHNVKDSSPKDSKGEDFAIVAYTPNNASALEFDLSFLRDSSYVEKVANIANAICEKTPNKVFLQDFIRQDFSHLECLQAHSYPQCYLEESARIRFFGIDLGADVLLVDTVEQFCAFDSQASKSAKAYNRDMDNTKAMFLPQLALRCLR